MQGNTQTLSKKCKELEEKYLTPISINSNILRTRKNSPRRKTPFRRFVTIFLDVLCTLLILLAIVMCFDTAVSYADGVAPSFLGYSNMRVVSGSMTWSGFKVNDVVVIRAVNPRTLKGGDYRVGDMIAFYDYSGYDSRFDPSTAHLLTEEEYSPRVQYDYNPALLLGFRNETMKQAAKANSRIIFHHIKDIYVDASGEYWFKTYGSSNADPIRVDEGDTAETHEQKEIGSAITMGLDSWYVHESLVVGVYDGSFFSGVVSAVVDGISASGGIILMLIPILLIAVVLIKNSIRDIQLAKLEMAIVEEKVPLTDDICIANGVGYRMDLETKLKVLAQADESEWTRYVSLLWQQNKVPPAVLDYHTARTTLLAPIVKKLYINRECERRMKEGENPTSVTEYYIKETSLINDEEDRLYRALKRLPQLFTTSDVSRLMQ